MKTKKISEISEAHNFDEALFEAWLRSSHADDLYTTGWDLKLSLDVTMVDKLVAEYKIFQQQHAKELQAANEAAEIKAKALPSILISSGFNFDGYTITKYSGYISGDGAAAVDRNSLYTEESSFWEGTKITGVGDELLAALADLRRIALIELKGAAYDLGCNAIIGVDFDYLTLDPVTIKAGGTQTFQPYMFAVTANGNAVVIERK